MKAAADLHDAERTLLRPPSGKEADRRAYIRSYLHHIGIPERAIRAEYRTQSNGPVDLYLTNRRIIIETKKEGRLRGGPCTRGTGSRSEESAFEQLERYVKDERPREQKHLIGDVDDGVPWLGILTDGRRWWAWEWEPRGDLDDASPHPYWQGKELTKSDLKNLESLLKRKTVGKEWATADMSSEFSDVKSDLTSMYEARKALRSTKTQHALWLEQLRGSGNAPKTDVDETFVLHTMLILISRMIYYSGTKYDEAKITEGFVNWVDMDRMDRLKSIIDRYNWRQQSGDILRSLYHDYVPDRHRRIYGEYYTPDWLAELMCEKVIDDGFIEDQIGNYNAGRQLEYVLDPSCGSGTFLYHAVKRIMQSTPVANSGMDHHDVVKLVCGMVRGVDIHPVAVEMSRANIRRLVPEAADSDIVVYQGDSLLTDRPESRLYGYDIKGKILALVSPMNRYLNLPSWFIKSPKDVTMFVETAKKDMEMTNGLGASLEGYDHEILLKAHNQLREIIREESDGVWKWYILNQSGPMNLLNSVGRIVSNPPWIRYNEIKTESRQNEIRDMAVYLKLWTGGKVSTSFDISSLFVDRCMTLYMKDKSKSAGWVLPHGSLGGGGLERVSCETRRRNKLHMEPTEASVSKHAYMRDLFRGRRGVGLAQKTSRQTPQRPRLVGTCKY